MAKKRATGNKSQAIREALAANPDKGPSEIAALLKDQGWKITGQYVSIIKSAGKAKAGGRVVRRKIGNQPLGGNEVENGFVAFSRFIQEAGGLEEAKAILKTLEEIKAAL